MKESGRTASRLLRPGRSRRNGLGPHRGRERSVGQVPDVRAEEALAFFTRRFEALELEVTLLETPDRGRGPVPDDALSSVRTVRADLTDANAVGDLDGLSARLEGLVR